ncbi:MAG: UV DNA damage repair endonuclease UvsE, partial [Nitrospirota bacterium]|nr:UV DNA damage repair endonuclease UvsE [Nitrospirota bacterium]
MKIGYPCINLSLSCRSSRTFRLASYSDERLRETVGSNLDCLQEILNYNAAHGFLFFRLTSGLVPFASHPVCTFPWQSFFREKLREAGDFIKANGMRISMHPDQFVLINSPSEKIFSAGVRELVYHAEVLDLMGIDASGKIQIHVGGVYGDRDESLKRFVSRYRELPSAVRKRLVIENDERLYSAADCLRIHESTGIPLVFDVFHYRCRNDGEGLADVVKQAAGTWGANDGILIVDYSSQAKNKRFGTHTESIDTKDFRAFLTATGGVDFDI